MYVRYATFASLLILIPVAGLRDARASDLFRNWVERTARVDSLYCKGKIELYRVPVEKDPTVQANWESRPGTCPTFEFEIWLRRPDFRIHIESYDPHKLSRTREVQHFSRLNERLFVYGGAENAQEHWGASINPEGRLALLSIGPFLTPLEFHFFDYPADDAPRILLDKPYEVAENAKSAIVQIQQAEPSQGLAAWLGNVVVEPARTFLPERLSLWIEDLPPHEPLWDMTTLETVELDGFPVISKARIVLYNPTVRRNERVVHLWQAQTIERRAVSLADIQLDFPPGTKVIDRVSQTEFLAGDPATVKKMDLELYRKVGQALAAQLATPAIQARRSAAMVWIIVVASAATVLLFLLSRKFRRRTRQI